MRAYELMVILDGDLEEPVAQAWVKTVTDQVAAAGGQVHGKRRLVGQAPLRLRDQPQGRGLLRGVQPRRRGRRPRRASSARSASRTRSSATS